MNKSSGECGKGGDEPVSAGGFKDQAGQMGWEQTLEGAEGQLRGWLYLLEVSSPKQTHSSCPAFQESGD